MACDGIGIKACLTLRKACWGLLKEQAIGQGLLYSMQEQGPALPALGCSNNPRLVVI